MKTKITILLALFLSFHSFAQVGTIFASEGLNYKITAATTVEVTQNPTTITGAIVIPTTVSYSSSNYAVTRIANLAFIGCKLVSEISIPSSVTAIGGDAFSSCSGLTSITIPNAVTSIGSYTFDSCKSLTSITIPNSVTNIGRNAFNSCTSLTSINIPTSVTSIEPQVFANCRSLTFVTIPNSVTTIGDAAFYGCISLTSVTIPNSVRTIGERIFNDCTGLTSVTIPNSVISIGYGLFWNCSRLVSITIPDSVKSIGNLFFQDCTSLTSFTIPSSVTSIGSSAFKNCKSLTSISIPNTVTSIDVGAFEGCTSLTSIAIPSSITSIGYRLFWNCSSLTSVNIPDSVTSIGGSAFNNCASLTSITIPNSVTSIGSSAFSSCSKLTSVTVKWTTPLSITRNVFDLLDLSTRSLNVPVGTETAYKAADVWKEFGTITEFVAPVITQKFATNGINYIVTKATLPYEVAVDANNNSNSGRFTTAVQTGITGAVTIPATVSNGGNSFSVTSIVANAFQNSTGLTSVTIPSSVTSIGDFAFSNCTDLTAVTVNGTTPIAINANVFENITLANVTLNVLAGTETAYKAATVWKDFKVETTLSTNSFLTNNALSFYPNPAQSQINFSQEINNLEVFDIAGRKVKTFQNSSNSFDVSNLVKGVYLLKGKTAEGKNSSQKMVKQ